MPSLSVAPRSASIDMRSGERRRAEQASAEARAFFVRPVHQPDRHRRPAVVFVRESAQHFQRRQHVQTAIQPAAVGHRIQMPADDQRLLRFAAQRDPAIARGVVVVLHRKSVELRREPLARLQPGVGPGDALRAVFVRRQCAKLLQFGDGSFGIQAHRFAQK